MHTTPQRIGVLTAGGDCPGLNAVIRSVVKSAAGVGIQVFGIENGFMGLVEDHVRPLALGDVSNILTRGGTILGSHNKCNPSKLAVKGADGKLVFADRRDDCMATLARHNIEALVVIGGDGSMSAAAQFIARGVRCVGVPKTIDNDLMGTDITFGFSTAVHVGAEALDRVHTTASSHHRVMLVELMGRNAGWIALHAGVASGADVILIPEIPYRVEAVADKIRSRHAKGKGYTIIAVGEGAKPAGGLQTIRRLDPSSPDPVRLGGVSEQLAEQLEAMTGIEARATVLGYVQRGGTPVAEDRILGTAFGHAAVNLILAGQFDRMVVRQKGELTSIPILEVAHKQRMIPLDHPLLAAAKAVGVSFGEM